MTRRVFGRLLSLGGIGALGAKAEASAPKSKFDRLLLVGLHVSRSSKYSSATSCSFGDADYFCVFGMKNDRREACQEIGSFRTSEEAWSEAHRLQAEHGNIPLEIWKEYDLLRIDPWEEIYSGPLLAKNRNLSRKGLYRKLMSDIS